MVKSILAAMKTMRVSDFEARCLATLEEVQRSRRPLLVTRRGRPLAVVGPGASPRSGKQLGCLRGRMTFRRDIVRIGSSRDWEMLR